jgi:hypothetical protein
MIISGIEKLRKFPNIPLNVAPSSIIIGAFTDFAIFPIIIPKIIAIISFGSKPNLNFFFSVVSILYASRLNPKLPLPF